MGLITKEVEIRLNGSNIKYYENMGYEIPRRIKGKYGKPTVPLNTKINVNVNDLPKNSNVKIQYECDGCRNIKQTSYANYCRSNKNGEHYCTSCNNKIFQSGKNNGRWNENLTQKDREHTRNYKEYREFTYKVMARDHYTCVCCGKHTHDIDVHHLDGYNWCIEKRLDVSNGITLCSNCHKTFHANYGTGNNTKEQFEEWIGKTLTELDSFDINLLGAKIIHCIETNEDNICNYFSKKLNISNVSIYQCCNHTRNINTIKGYHFLWKDDYDKLLIEYKNDNNIIFELNTKNNNNIRVICLNTLQIFDSIAEACRYYNIKTQAGISMCCRGIRKSCGKLNNGTKLIWMFYNDYIKLTDSEKENKINYIRTQQLSKYVVCLELNEVFKNASFAEEKYKKYHVNTSAVINCCNNGRSKSSGEIKGKRLHWMYYLDYINLYGDNLELKEVME